jgi:hypothetical protein
MVKKSAGAGFKPTQMAHRDASTAMVKPLPVGAPRDAPTRDAPKSSVGAPRDAPTRDAPKSSVGARRDAPKSLEEILKTLGNNRAYNILKHSGNTWVIHFEGDADPMSITFEDGKPVMV